MADYQYAPKRHDGQDPTLDLADAIINMNGQLEPTSRCPNLGLMLRKLAHAVAGIRKFAMPPPNEDFPVSAFLPPPAFSRHTVPQIFEYVDVLPKLGFPLSCRRTDIGPPQHAPSARHRPRHDRRRRDSPRQRSEVQSPQRTVDPVRPADSPDRSGKGPPRRARQGGTEPDRAEGEGLARGEALLDEDGPPQPVDRRRGQGPQCVRHSRCLRGDGRD